MRSVEKWYRSLESATCQIRKSDTYEKLNILQLIGIEDQLQMSILLNLTPKTGLASLMNYSHPTSEFTRILSFHYVSGEERLPDTMK